ncbi:RING finger protein 38, partial [Termitomyces sp. T112]
MSSSCPPQLRLDLPAPSTSFKRSFDQFGFDLDSPAAPPDGPAPSPSDRNKRARSASSFDGGGDSDSDDDGDDNNNDDDSDDTTSSSSSSSTLASTHDPPRLPTPSQDTYRISLDRFTAFDTQIAALRQSTPPPVLPPLDLLGAHPAIPAQPEPAHHHDWGVWSRGDNNNNNSDDPSWAPLAQLRSPSPLHLPLFDNIDPTTQRRETSAPPVLPPIQGQGHAEFAELAAWDVHMDHGTPRTRAPRENPWTFGGAAAHSSVPAPRGPPPNPRLGDASPQGTAGYNAFGWSMSMRSDDDDGGGLARSVFGRGEDGGYGDGDGQEGGTERRLRPESEPDPEPVSLRVGDDGGSGDDDDDDDDEDEDGTNTNTNTNSDADADTDVDVDSDADTDSEMERLGLSEGDAMRILEMVGREEGREAREGERFTDVFERVVGRLGVGTTQGGTQGMQTTQGRMQESLERLRRRAVELEEEVRSLDGDEVLRLYGPPPPTTSTFLGDASSRRERVRERERQRERERELPANVSMLFDDAPLLVMSTGGAWRTAATATAPGGSVGTRARARDAPTTSLSSERLRLNERPWVRTAARAPTTTTLGTSLSNFRARPYVGLEGMHGSGQRYLAPLSTASSSSNLNSTLTANSTPTANLDLDLDMDSMESAGDAQRRVARLGFVQMQRRIQRERDGAAAAAAAATAGGGGSGRTTTAPVESAFAQRPFAQRPLAPRPRGFETSFPPRSSSPDRNSFRMRLAQQRARFDGFGEVDGTATGGTGGTTGRTYDAGVGVERGRGYGLHYVRRAGESTTSSEDLAGGRRLRLGREPTSAEFLPVPSLPSPGLEFEFVSPPPAVSASESHGDYSHGRRTSSMSGRTSRQEIPQRTLSPVFRRRFERSESPPPVPPPPPPPPLLQQGLGVHREVDVEAFAPGPFRNTVQSFWPTRSGGSRTGGRSRGSPTRGTGTAQSQSQTQSQSLVAPPSLPPLAFEEDHRVQTHQRLGLGRSSGDVRNEAGEGSVAQLRALLNRRPLADGAASSQRFGDFLDSPLDVLDRIYMPQSSSSSSSTDVYPPADERSVFDGPSPGWLPDDDNTSPMRSSASSYRPPWRAPRPPPNPPSDLHSFLNRHRRTEAVGREARRPPPLRGHEDGFSHAIEALRNGGSGTGAGRSQEVASRLQREASREPRAWASVSPWGLLEGSGSSSSSRQTSSGGNDQSDGEGSVFQRRRRQAHAHAHPLDPFQMDVSDDEIDVVSAVFQDRARVLNRRVRGPGEAPVFPRRIPAFMRANSAAARRGRPLGDYVRDEDWNSDYESLLSLAAQLGEVKPRCTPDNVIDSLESAVYKDWNTP